MSLFGKFDGPKSGNRYKVLGICRISTEHQREESLTDQEQLYRRKLDELYGPDRYHLRIIASRGSGERLDSAALMEAVELSSSGNYDLVICEDLGRICRRVQAIVFVESALDVGTRVIAVNDHLDTDKDGWRLSACFAVLRHEQYNADTSARIRRTQLNQFNQGRQLPCAIYGYLKPKGARHESELTKDPAAEPIYELMFSMLESGHSFADVADKLNELNVPLGSICKRARWDSTMVGRIVRNPILKGLREHNRRVTYRIHSTGRHVTRKAKDTETVSRYVSHLAFIEPDRYDRIIAMVSERNKRFSRSKNGHDPLLNRPKKATKWPGQHCYCGVCGRVFIYGKSGNMPFLKCSGLTEHNCWNGFYITPQLMREKVTAAILEQIAQLPDFDAYLRDNLTAETENLLNASSLQSSQLTERIREFERQLGNLATSIARLGGNETLEAQLRQLQTDKQQAQAELRHLESQMPIVPQLPPIEQIRKQALTALQSLSVESKEFNLLVRKMISRLIVYPTALIGGRSTYGYRVKFRLKLWQLFDANLGKIPSVGQHLTKVVVLDLDDGPQHVRHLQEIVRLRSSGLTEPKVMDLLKLTRPVITRAMSLHRNMEQLGVIDPWEELKSMEGRECRVRAHLHPRYIFKPVIPTDDWL